MVSKSLFAHAALVAGALAQGPSVKTTHGEVVGKVLGSKVKTWMGIPFAKSPPERFSAPEEAAKWSKPLDASKAKAACIQQFIYPEASRNLTIHVYSTPMPEESEDCLYVNVWAPDGTPPKEGWPVMFWIYGGNLQFGHAALPMYSGEHLASKHNVIVVGANYRTNVFGFPGSPELEKGKNNLGFLDQRKALDWANKNVAAFGGNPSKVTLFGESAGGFSTKQLVVTPPSPLPFHAAIMQSQASGVRGTDESWGKLAKALNCGASKQLACLRATPVAQIKDIIERQRIDFGPLEDGTTYVKDVRPKIRAGQAAKVPVIMGTNSNEGTPFVTIGLVSPGATLDQVFGAFVPGGPEIAKFLLGELKPLFNATELNTDHKMGSAIFTDLGFTCGTSEVAKAFVDGGYDVYRYYYAGDFPEQYPYKDARAYHGGEIPTIFKTYDPKIKAMDRLSGVMSSYWAGFATNPTAPLQGWPKLSKTAQQARKLANNEDGLVAATELDVRCETITPFIEGVGM